MFRSLHFPSVRAFAASTELKLVASYLAIPPGQYLAKHSAVRLAVGSVRMTTAGEFRVRIPFQIDDPSKVRRCCRGYYLSGEDPALLTVFAFQVVDFSREPYGVRL